MSTHLGVTARARRAMGLPRGRVVRRRVRLQPASQSAASASRRLRGRWASSSGEPGKVQHRPLWTDVPLPILVLVLSLGIDKTRHDGTLGRERGSSTGERRRALYNLTRKAGCPQDEDCFSRFRSPARYVPQLPLRLPQRLRRTGSRHGHRAHRGPLRFGFRKTGAVQPRFRFSASFKQLQTRA